ncbi:MarR family winged helix-turn-helix transcriptional regulator [Aestuariispira insulae]|uniref:DNA-binding MarR family transcriptional regulator n=1 Tax=Aestuariispira insulae TaxID=1461337 RepID=A0A3D9HSN7_9PROT|nr:MarR family winged helix-turn-helix transcriptional regulator [Aestuariispira insulae]RED52522.1 DNA-binding MarR family transcriptional regulator [Aestuariispira insulae]
MTEFSRRHPPEGDAMFDLISNLMATFFKLRAAGKQVSEEAGWGSGTWSLMRTIQIEGPQTVPQLAKRRPVARQRMQKIADDLVAQGLAQFINNPRHKRSQLLDLTAKGHNHVRRTTEQIRDMADVLATGMDLRSLDVTNDNIRELQKRLSRIIE